MKERLMVQKLIDEFIKNDDSAQIALLIGIRRIGKTTILKQILNKYENAKYIDVKPYTQDLSAELSTIIDSGISLLLIDEFTSLVYYDTLAQSIYDKACIKNVKIIITASSPYHLFKLAMNELGGGRSDIYKLPPITFIEYLYFTDKIVSYNDISNINNKWFVDYLKLDGLSNNLKIKLNSSYFNSWFENNEEINDNTYNGHSKNDITGEEIYSLFNLIAYKLANAPKYNEMIKPKVGLQEHTHIFPLNLGYKLSHIDLTDLILTKSIDKITTLSISKIAEIILFLIDSGMAIISISNINTTINEVKDALKTCIRYKNISDIFKEVSIILTSPLYYTRIGEEIFDRFDVTLDVLEKGYLTGLILEIYIISSLYYNINILTYNQYKLNDYGEVDIFIPSIMLILESTISNKKSSEIHLGNYFKDKLCIRICCSKDKDKFNGIYHEIPYGKLMCILDNKSVFNLTKTIIENE